jgi:hypothetical protein
LRAQIAKGFGGGGGLALGTTHGTSRYTFCAHFRLDGTRSRRPGSRLANTSPWLRAANLLDYWA